MMASVEWDRYPAHFVAITYHWNGGGVAPAAVPDAPGTASPREPEDAPPPPPEVWRRWKRDLAALRKRIARQWGGRFVGGLWKMEFQRRGAVHFHLALFWAEGKEPGVHDLAEWLAKAWNEIAEPGDLAHLLHGSHVQEVRNRSGAGLARLMGYLAKYMAKEFDVRLVDLATGEIIGTGRCWGKWGLLPCRVLAVFEFGWREYILLTRRVRRWGRGSRYLSRVTASWSGWLLLADGYLVSTLWEGLQGRMVDT